MTHSCKLQCPSLFWYEKAAAARAPPCDAADGADAEVVKEAEERGGRG